ncbi:cytoskeleton protein RodZ [uncultured Tolumonas sp.]|uniref:cytoskeleton protein RodZ n=1 Tax=uncultured Tolumonas sp. TaxID=263765 RepID=UPI00292F0AB0|nr:cytoskeleton protein RodZ [uncultured Tolumonas sp.]
MTTEQRHETAQLTPGTILKTAREQRGMSQQDVAHRLNLRISLIRDIEEDRFDQKTASTFTRGYLKTYARFVGTDEQAVLAAYDRLGLKDQQYSEMYSFSGRTQREASEHRVRFISWVLFIGLAGLGGTWWWLQPAEEPVPTAINEAGQLVVKATDAVLAAKPSAAQATTANPVATTSAAPVTATSSAEDTAETSTDLPVAADNDGQEPTVLSNAAAEEKNQEQTKIVPASSAAVASTTTTKSETADSTVDASIALQLQFKASCWLRVADASGKSLFEGTKNAGDKVNVSGKEPFSLTIGAPRAVSVYFHGQAVDMSSYIRQGVVARYKLPLKN